MIHRAVIRDRSAELSSDFGYEKAVQWFGQDVVDSLPTYQRGPKKGKPKGFYLWTKIEKGGWVPDRDHPDGGFVENRSGSIIKRELKHLETGRYGPCVSKLVTVEVPFLSSPLYCNLEQGETLMDKIARRAAEVREHLADEAFVALDDFRYHMAVVRQLRMALKKGVNNYGEVLTEDVCDTLRKLMEENREEARTAFLDWKANQTNYLDTKGEMQ